MSNNHKQWLAWIIALLATLAVALFFGVQYPLPEPPEGTVEPIELGANFANPVDIEDAASAASPALTFQDDTDTGLWRSAANTLNVSTAGTERLEVDASEFTIVPPLTVNNNATVTGTLNLQGNLYDTTGATTVGDQLEIVGQENAQQLWVQGYTTQTANLFTAYNSALSTLFAIGGSGAVDARGNISDGGGTLTLEDDTLIDGAADANQLTVQGYTTQTNSLQVWEQSDGTDVATMSNAGALQLDSNADVDGNIDLAGILYLTRDGANVGANGTVVTPTTSWVELMATGSYTFTLADGSDGQILFLKHDGGPQLTLDESECNADIGGDKAFDTRDSLLLIWDGSNWVAFGDEDN